MNKLDNIIKNIRIKKTNYIFNQDFENAAKFRMIERDLIDMTQLGLGRFISRFRDDVDVYYIIKPLDVRYQRKLKIEKLYNLY